MDSLTKTPESCGFSLAVHQCEMSIALARPAKSEIYTHCAFARSSLTHVDRLWLHVG
jgi:hypothetical protein